MRKVALIAATSVLSLAVSSFAALEGDIKCTFDKLPDGMIAEGKSEGKDYIMIDAETCAGLGGQVK